MIHCSLIPDHPHPMEQTVRLTAPRSGTVVELNKAGAWLVLPRQRLSLTPEKLREVLATWFVCAEQFQSLFHQGANSGQTTNTNTENSSNDQYL